MSGDKKDPGSHEDGGGAESRSSPVALLVAMLAMVVCCGLPFLIVAAGGLAPLSVITGRYAMPFASAALVVALLVIVGIAVRSMGRGSRSRRQQTETSGEACCG